MPASSAPSFSLATARIALPVSVRAMNSHSASATTNTATKAMSARHRDEGEAEIDALEAVGEIDGAGVGAEGVEQCVLDDDREPERDQQHVAVVAMRRRADDKALQAIAEREEHRRQQETPRDRDRARAAGKAKKAANIAALNSAPWAKLMMCSTP